MSDEVQEALAANDAYAQSKGYADAAAMGAAEAASAAASEPTSEPTSELAASEAVQEPIAEGETEVATLAEILPEAKPAPGASEIAPEYAALQPIPVGTEIVKQPNGWWTFKVPGLPARIAEGVHVADAAASLGYTFAD